MKDKIKQDIKDRGMTRSQYAQLFRVNERQVYQWLQGKYSPNVHMKMLMELTTEILKGIKGE